ncbi:unnamed protein product [Toxocara canis]|uniref:Uncharacterized protein n=1 Tax=Toxocara canis TaxID=6265 RepID=A0A3P7IP34_TOXCA|nr:unnamed protein product [Toxocara canis]
MEAQYIHSGCKQKFHEKSVRSTTIPHKLADAHRYPSTQHQTQSYSTAMLANTDDRSLRTEYAEPVLFGDETVYGDDWSNSGSLQGRLTIARTSSIGDMNGSRNDSITILSQIVSEINRRRKLSDDTELNKDARDWAGYLVLSDQFRCREGSSMNVWIGTKPTIFIVDEWERDMRSWTGNVFRSESLTRIGIGRAYDDRKHAFIIVAEYK